MTEKKLFVGLVEHDDFPKFKFDGRIFEEATPQDLKDLGYIKVEPKMPIGEYLTKLIQGGLDAGRDAETISLWCWAFFVDLEPNMKDLGWVRAEPTTCKGCIFLDEHKKIDISARGWWCDRHGLNFYHDDAHPNMICLSRLTKGDLCEYCKDIETCNAKQARGKGCFFQPVGDNK